MKILQVIPYFSWSYGGPVRVVYELAHKLAERDHEVTIYTTDVARGHRIGESEKIIVAGDIDIRYFKCLSNYAASRFDLHLSRQMQTAFKREIGSFDIVHTHEWRGFHNACVWHYARKYGIPYVLQAHGALPKALDQQSNIFVLAKHVSDAIINTRVLRDASKAIALTQAEALAYEELGVEKRNIAIVPNGLDLSQFEKLPARGTFREKYGIESNEKIVLFLARIHKTKGLELLLRAFCGLQNEVADAKLVIAGPDGGYLARVSADISRLGITDNVLLTGPLYGQAKLEAYVDAEAYVLPSSYDMFPVSPIEACACGVPTIVTNRCGFADAIEGVGCVVDYDADQLLSAMRLVITSAQLRDKMRIKGPAMVRERYDLEKVVDDLEQLYATCLRR